MNERDDIVAEFDPCPDDETLEAVLTGQPVDSRLQDSIKAHVRLCSSCRRKAKNFAPSSAKDNAFIKLAAQRLKDRQDEIKSKSTQSPRSGSVWRTVPESEDDLYGPLVIVLNDPAGKDPELVQVAEVSEEIQQAIDTDIVLERRTGGLSFDFMIRASHVFWTKRENLKAYAGEISTDAKKNILDFCLNVKHFNESIPLSEHQFAKNDQGHKFMRRRGIVSGIPATSHDDARLALLDLSKRRISYLVTRAPQVDSPRVVSLPVDRKRNRLVQVLLPLAAMVAAAMVTAGVMYVSSQRSLARLQAKQQQEILDLDRYYDQQAEAALKKVAEAQTGEEALKSKLSSLDQEKAELQKRIAQLDGSLAVRNKERASLKSRLEELDDSNVALKRENAKVASQRQDAERRLAKLSESRPRLFAADQQMLSRSRARMDEVAVNQGRGKELLQAARSGNLDLVMILLGLDKNLVRFVDETQGFTALHWATYEDHANLAAYLIKQGAPVDGRDYDGETPLMLAARLGFPEITELLLKNGADRAQRNRESKTALDLALANGHKEVAEILQSP
jgi:hypothetical protein